MQRLENGNFMGKYTLIIVACCVSLLVSACGHLPQEDVATVGKQAPDFTLMDREGKTWTLSELKGQVVLVHFWATWCPPCVEEMPLMERLYTTVPGDKFKMLAILYNDKQSNADFFAAKNKITMPILNDQKNTVGPKYGLTGVPETYIVDKQGVVREKFIGAARWDSPKAMQMLMGYINQGN